MYIFATSALALKSMPTANPGLVALLRSWTTAAENANHSSQQASTLRKAARSLAAHPTPVTCKEDALNVKFILPVKSKVSATVFVAPSMANCASIVVFNVSNKSCIV